MKDVLNACQVDALLPSEELDHANPSDVIFRIAPAVGGRPLRLDQVLALVNHQGAGVEVEDLAGDAGREYGRPGGDRRHALTLSHINPGAEHSPALPRPRARYGWHRRGMDSKVSSTSGAAASRWWSKRRTPPVSR